MFIRKHKPGGELDMMGANKLINERFHQGSDANKEASGNQKAANITEPLLSHQQDVRAEKWTDALQTYSDYFIRY